ncbi:uncharacterized protein LOC111246511 isoform X3 [Varroa destructor]|uniref:Uncharacterized protein n=1 Tax=Varroa destructor TaxID=109461 RepID=A0A7M7MCH4_VARDE|nr:uncharacterized protein LOC111246511 isoform X3 [Varroa destructor]XP_022652001.1 uncharacterized protein LOC111246511 isoform X3 [Varroa destructor]XP_022652011.1 uncharacterized protein LOC111246511 isoform X3 [Varroa destructor]XP_022652021.1 uncharacterized protein LOC111246511 isoform X3 [Varroa destructor]
MEEPLLKRRYRPLGKPGLGSAIAHAVPVVVGAAVKNPGFFRNFIYANPPFAGPAIRDAVNMAFRRRVLTRVRGSLEIYEYWKDIRLNRNTDPDMNVPNENTFDTSFTSRFIEIKFSPKELYKKIWSKLTFSYTAMAITRRNFVTRNTLTARSTHRKSGLSWGTSRSWCARFSITSSPTPFTGQSCWAGTIFAHHTRIPAQNIPYRMRFRSNCGTLTAPFGLKKKLGAMP